MNWLIGSIIVLLALWAGTLCVCLIGAFRMEKRMERDKTPDPESGEFFGHAQYRYPANYRWPGANDD